MPCPECGSEQVPFRVPADVRDLLRDEAAAAAICRRCLAVEWLDDAGEARAAGEADAPAAPDLRRVSDAFPSDPDAAVLLALAVGLLSSLAVNRDAIADLLERVERAGTDPLLALSRLAGDPELDPAVDLRRRRTQLEQLL